MTVCLAPPFMIPAVWPMVEASLEPSCVASATHDTADVHKLLMQGHSHLAIDVDEENNVRGCAVFDFVTYPKGTECRVWLAGSNGKPDRAALEAFIEDLCKRRGCRWLSGFGRDGWERFLKGTTYPYIRKELMQ